MRILYLMLVISLSLFTTISFSQDQTYVLLGEQGQAKIRVLTNETLCPRLTWAGQPHYMVERSGPEQKFSGRVCELSWPSGVSEVFLGGQKLPAPESFVQKIVVVGDTGCRQKGSFAQQDCKLDWKWPQVAQAAALEKPDLVIHVGDYLYRESPCTGQNCQQSTYGDQQETWMEDFFNPAQPLLQQAPWVFVRGNHESCGRAGIGWFRYLESHQPNEQPHCQKDMAPQSDMMPPYRVPLSHQEQLLVMDTAEASNRNLAAQQDLIQAYSERFKQVQSMILPQSENWLVLHHPPLGYGYRPVLGYLEANSTLIHALEPLQFPGLFPPYIGLTIAGHVHAFELNRFAGQVPVGFVAGFGGTKLEPPFPSEGIGQTQPIEKVDLLQTETDTQFGYGVIEWQGRHWRLMEKTATGKIVRQCVLQTLNAPYGYDCQRLEDIPKDLGLSDYIILGEVHDNAKAHALRLSWLQNLAKNKKIALAFEQFDSEYNELLQKAQQEQDTPQEIEAKAHFDAKGWNWSFYEPLVQLAIQNRWPMGAANLSRSQMGAIMMGSEPSPATPQHWSQQQQEQERQEVKVGHCGLLPEDQLDRFVSAQQARDRRMAAMMVTLHQKTGLPVVLIAGNGHARKDLAVPVWLAQLDPKSTISSVAVLERHSQDSDPRANFDEVYWVDEEERPDPCVLLKKRFQRHGLGGAMSPQRVPLK